MQKDSHQLQRPCLHRYGSDCVQLEEPMSNIFLFKIQSIRL